MLFRSCDTTLLVLFEDAHWLDPTSLELLGKLIQAGQTLPVLFVVTHRPEFRPHWSRAGFLTTLQLNRLPRRDSTTIVEAVSGGKSLPEDVVEEILARTDGVALFVEELTKTVLNSGALKEESDRFVLVGDFRDLAIPATLHDSLLARLDRLGDAKDVAQVAACVGREFSFELLKEGLNN